METANGNLMERLRDINVDVDGTLNRFVGNEALYRKFLIKFLDDPTFAQIAPALDVRDMDQAFNLVHTLKGVTGNLGLTRLYQASVEMTEALRARSYEEAVKVYPELTAAYEEIVQLLRGEA